MADPLSSVEDELRKIEEDFHAGRMNAFGNTASRESMEKELEKIKAIDDKIFAQMGKFLGQDDADEWHLRRALEPQAVPEPAGGISGATSFGVKGVSDSAFAGATEYFAKLETNFAEIGGDLRKMAGHVVALNQLAEVNNVGGSRR
jgi:hypothetical protein